jgi:hypothetical protein
MPSTFPHTAWMEMDSDEEKRLLREFLQTFETILSTSVDVRVVVISSALPEIFSAGVDRYVCLILPLFSIPKQNKYTNSDRYSPSKSIIWRPGSNWDLNTGLGEILPALRGGTVADPLSRHCRHPWVCHRLSHGFDILLRHKIRGGGCHIFHQGKKKKPLFRTLHHVKNGGHAH